MNRLSHPVLGLLAGLAIAAAASPSRSQEALTIGVSEPLTGNVAQFGLDARRGAELAAAEANAAGGVLGRPVALEFQDNRCNPSEAARSVTQMIADKKPVAVLDGLCSSAALAIMPIIERAEIPFITANASATSIAERSGVGGNKWAFKVNPSDAGLADALVEYLVKIGTASNLAFLGEDTDFGRSGAAGLEAALGRHGLKLASTDFYQSGTPDFSPVLTRLRARKPAQIAIYSLGADFKNLIRQIASNDVRIPLTGRLLPDDVPAELRDSGAFDGLTAVQPYSSAVDTPANKTFIEAYRKKFGDSPTQISFESYETTLVLLDAIKRAGSAAPAAIRDALTKTSLPSILGGTIAFDDHNLAHNNAVVLGIKGGKIVVLDFTKT